ncbi:Glycosyl hydrolases family 2, sugar binding domain [Salegentibacter agarivorans]|uniref:Glycosyl hydrolases family 2, sugar binding domain n=1 Tax=Salegentibacter agarivorans TaxID=345907 RepID=A0A1I2MDQ3_9FLAO|nr:glycosyl hydrolase [Salegentibacter agarivorans]SFF89605.1 Glycosyl hydrolases family 2, sugar binding domain [Salegentibacter agarivorans]
MKAILTKYLVNKVTVLLLVVLPLYACNDKEDLKNDYPAVSIEELRTNFKTPPENVKPWTYWYWINNHISKEGITKDLEAMAEVGIGAALIGNIFLDDIAAEEGEVSVLSPEWKELTQHAIREGDRVGVDIGLFNSPGWSQSGGPWNDESNSMRYLTSSELKVEGGKRIEKKLEAPTDDFEDVSVLAIPSRNVKSYQEAFNISSDKKISNLNNLMDNDTATTVSLSDLENVTLLLEAEENQTLRSLKIYPSRSTLMMDVKLLAEINGSWEEIRNFEFDRRSAMDQLGYDDYPPVVVSFPEVNAKKFRIELRNINATLNSKEIGLSEIQISSIPQLEYYTEKQLGKMHQTPLPLDDAYRWPDQQEPSGEGLLLTSDSIIDISDKLLEDGTLNWDVPEGEWTILRTGMTTTGITNSPAASNAKGLEVDKINKEALQQHFDGFVGDILESMPAEERKALKYVVADSYETGSQNWTNDFEDTFQETYGYDPIIYLPVMTGRIVNSVGESNRFLWDLRRLIADKVADEYVGGLREISEENGLKLWLENYGHWGFPSEFLRYGGQSHLVAGEFWAEGDLGSIECRAASSAAHIYGKTQVSAESYTAAGGHFMRHPGRLKIKGDWSFTEGINHPVFHVYIQQPYEDKVPGVNAWFGTEFNRHNTWFTKAKPWVDYQRRSQYMLQQGKYVADVAYFIGEDAPKMTGVMNPELPAGYSFDYINADVIMNRLSVEDGRLTLPDGLSYKILVLPEVETMRPEVLEKIEDLVSQGAVIMGNPPKKSPSLQNYPEADEKVEKLSKELWGENDENIEVVDYGEGRVFPYKDLDQTLVQLGTVPDFKTDTEQPVLWIHRRLADKDIYFITNQSEERISFDASFRVKDMQPEIWDATTGTTRALPEFSETDHYTQIPLQLEPAESGFIVFSKGKFKSESDQPQNYESAKTLTTIDEKWDVQFKNEKIGINKEIAMDGLEDWIESEDNDIKYFSGTANYRNTFNLEKIPSAKKIFLDIGKADVLANIKINGSEVGGLWTAPWRIDVTEYLIEGKNDVEIEVTNLWINQLIADDRRREGEKKTWVLVEETYNSANSLQPSGLKGPIKLVSFDGMYSRQVSDKEY